jgi:16S rRNA (uracil1498-N3)-methyltransferase
VRALRLSPGDELCAIVAPGRERRATIQTLARDHAVLALGEDLPAPAADPRAPRTLALALGDPARMELVVEKATELGVTAILPFAAERSQLRGLADARLERWRRIARAACEQCGRTVEPEVLACADLDAVVARVPDAAESWLLSPWRADDAAAARFTAAAPPAAGELLLVIGPEGGLTDAENARLRDAGARPVTLGRRVLRFETAAIAALALALARFPE